MNELEKEEKFLKRVRVLLDESADALNPETGLRLREIRAQALESPVKSRFSLFAAHRWVTVGGFATVATAILAVFFWLHAPSSDSLPKQDEDFEILTSREHIDFYKDLDFFLWLETKEHGS
jgi:hypothetical protein